MMIAIEVTNSTFRLSQNQQDKTLTYYRYNQPIKTETCEKLYSPQELFDLLCEFAYGYNVKEDTYIG